MTAILIDVFYLAVLALVVAAAVYLYLTRGEAEAVQTDGETDGPDTAA